MRFIFRVFAGIILLISSCKVSTHIHFKADHSGTVTIACDFSKIMDTSDSSETQDSSFITSMMKSLQNMDTIPQLKNFKVRATPTGFELFYHFDNPEELNQSLEKMNQNDFTSTGYSGKFTVKKRKIKFELPKSEEKTNNKDFEIMSSIKTMGILDWEYTVSFDQEIKKCSNKNFTIAESKHAMTCEGSVENYTDPNHLNFTVKLKK